MDIKFHLSVMNQFQAGREQCLPFPCLILLKSGLFTNLFKRYTMF